MRADIVKVGVLLIFSLSAWGCCNDYYPAKTRRASALIFVATWVTWIIVYYSTGGRMF